MLKYFSLTKCQLLESYIQAFQFTPPRFCNSLFEKEKPIHKFKQKSNQKIFHHNYTWNYKHTSIIHKYHKKKATKRHFHFIHNLSHSSNESPQKSSLTFPSQNAQKRISKNASTFKFKRTCVFLQT